MQASDVIILNTPRGDLNECISSSYGLSFFPQHGVLVMARTQRPSWVNQSISIGELLSEIDQLDEVDPRNVSLPFD
jgi:hypothetical protein